MNRRTRRTVTDLKRQLQELYGLRLSRVILYGSQARGEQEPYSDIDLLIVLRGSVHPGDEIARIGGLIADLSLRTDSVITPLFMDEERYLARAGPLLRNIRREGIPL